MARYIVAGMVVAALAVGIWLLLPEGGTPPTTSWPIAEGSTTSSSTSTTIPPTSSSTTLPESHVVTTIEEAEEVLRDLWFGWFEGIYNQDEDRIREVVATESRVADAMAQFGVMQFIERPTRQLLAFSETDILRSDSQCLAVWAISSAEAFLGAGAERLGVDIFRWADDRWMMVSSWVSSEDLWESDCDGSFSY